MTAQEGGIRAYATHPKSGSAHKRRTTTMDEDNTKQLGKVIKIDQTEVQRHVDEVVRGTVEETLNGLLDAEAEQRVHEIVLVGHAVEMAPHPVFLLRLGHAVLAEPGAFRLGNERLQLFIPIFRLEPVVAQCHLLRSLRRLCWAAGQTGGDLAPHGKRFFPVPFPMVE